MTLTPRETVRPDAPTPPATLTFHALAPCCEAVVGWSQVWGEQAAPDDHVCEEAPCQPRVSAAADGKMGGQLHIDETRPLTGATNSEGRASNPQLDHYIERG